MQLLQLILKLVDNFVLMKLIIEKNNNSYIVKNKIN